MKQPLDVVTLTWLGHELTFEVDAEWCESPHYAVDDGYEILGVFKNGKIIETDYDLDKALADKLLADYKAKREVAFLAGLAACKPPAPPMLWPYEKEASK